MNHSKENELKRMNKTAIALATAGAMTLGVAPAAMAVEPASADACYLDANGQKVGYKKKTDANNVTVLVDDNGKGPGPDMKQVDCADEQQPSGAKTAKFRDQNGVVFDLEVDPADPTQPKNKPASDSVYTLVDPDKDLSVKPAEGPSDKDIAKAVAAVAAAGVGAAIIINGIKYFVNKDKQTLVPSEDRVNQEPTAEEKAKSDELKANNADQIAQQTGTDATGANTTANGERGMSAATGVNKVPAALMALLLASVLGAAAFVFGRRQLV